MQKEAEKTVLKSEKIKKLIGKIEIKKIVCYSGDGPFDEETEKIYKDADILMHECYMFDQRIKGHVAAIDVFEIAKRNNVKLLLLSHFKRAFNDETRRRVQEAIPGTGLKIIMPQPLDEYET